MDITKMYLIIVLSAVLAGSHLGFCGSISRGVLHHQTLGHGTNLGIHNVTLPDNCNISVNNPDIVTTLKDLIKENTKLIVYKLHFNNYTEENNPLTHNIKWHYKLYKWWRVTSFHGRSLMSLAFNYDILSLTTLTFGTEKMHIDLHDYPYGCFGDLDEDVKFNLLLDLLMKDFQDIPNSNYEEEDNICHQQINEKGRFGHFSDRCCGLSPDDRVFCSTEIDNIFLKIIHWAIRILTILVFLFGPMLIPTYMWSGAWDCHTYMVRLKTPFYRTLKYFVQNKEKPEDLPELKKKENAKHVLDLTRAPKLRYLKGTLGRLSPDRKYFIKVSEYELSVNYRKVLTEDDVPIGLWQAIARMFCACKIRYLGPFVDCCNANMFGRWYTKKPVPWIFFWKMVARFLIVMLVPLPYYLRLIVYYRYEHGELLRRKEFINSLGLWVDYNFTILHYLSPTHPIFITIYCLYYIVGLLLAYGSMNYTDRQSEFRKVTIGSFKDMENLSWMNAIGLNIDRFLWPFERFGLLGFIVGIFFWPIAIPFFLLISCFYCFPIVYLTFRMLYYTRKNVTLFNLEQKAKKERRRKARHGSPQQDVSYHVEEVEGDKKRKYEFGDFRNELNLNEISPDRVSIISHDSIPDDDSATNVGQVQEERKCKCCTQRVQGIFVRYLVAIICIATLLGTMLILAEVIGFVLEVFVFTTMGVIINAGSVLTYVCMFILLGIYYYDCFNNVYIRYLSLNRTLFAAVKNLIEELHEVTSLPSTLQVNQGFKPSEIVPQVSYDEADDISEKENLSLFVNDMVLFVDHEDMPRIPRKLFTEVCNIEVAGAPGPVYRSLLEATGKLMIMNVFLLFILLVVLSFGQVYQVSAMSQMLATIAGGLLPFLLRFVFKPTSAEVQLETLSFKGKLDEIIARFCQTWPMHDFPFRIVPEGEYKRNYKPPVIKDKDIEEEVVAIPEVVVPVSSAAEDDGNKESEVGEGDGEKAEGGQGVGKQGQVKEEVAIPVFRSPLEAAKMATIDEHEYDVDMLVVVPHDYKKWTKYKPMYHRPRAMYV